MKPTKRRWLRLAIAPGLAALAMIGFASQAQANNYIGNCANYPGTFDGTGTVTINNTGTCTLNQAINAAGAVSITSSGAINTAFGITGASVNATTTSGAINAKAITSTSGNLVLTTTGANAVNADLVTANNGSVTVNSGAGATFTNTVQANFGSVGINAVTNISTKKVLAEYLLEIKTTTGKITVNGGTATSDALKVNNGPMNIVSKDLLTITGVTTSTASELQLESKLDLKANAISAGSHARINSTNGNINVTSTIDVNKSDLGGNLLIQAFNNVRTGAIKVNGPTTSGLVEIDANTGGGNVLFEIGSNATNGVTSIDTTATTGGGTDDLFGHRGVWITNGTATGTGSTGGISLTASNKLKLLNTASRSGIVWLNAQNGPITLPGGTAITTKGATNFSAGQIFLLCKDLTLGVDPVLEATQGKTIATAHGVTIAALTVTYQGTAGLKILADGSGKDLFNPAYAYILPQGSVSSTMTGTDFRSLFWTSPSIAAVPSTDKPLTITGSGTSPLTMSANGTNAAVAIRANDTNVNTGTITLTSKGGANHTITINDTGPFGDTKGLTLGSGLTPSIVLDASADIGYPGGSPVGGDIKLSSDKLTLNGVSYVLKAGGPAGNSGDGGTLRVSSTSPGVLGGTSTFTLNADATGTGNAAVGNVSIPGDRKAIQFYWGGGPLAFGKTVGVGQVSLSANGGSNSGNGGTIMISNGSSRLDLKTADAIVASAKGAVGDGGEIYSFNYLGTVDPLATVSAVGMGAGKGGKFTTFHDIQDIDILQYVKVDGGADVTSAGDDGSITLNNVKCRQWKLDGGLVWPNVHWVCTVNRELPQAKDKAASDLAVSPAFNSLRISFSNPLHKVNIFVFDDSAGFNSFWNEVLDPVAGGLTFRIPNSNNIYVNPWLSGSTGINVPEPYDANQASEVAGHEFGHAFDIINKSGNPLTLVSQTGTYNNWLLRDVNTLDYADAAFTVKRLPCAKTPIDPLNLALGYYPGKIPFDLVLDKRHGNSNVCVNGVLDSNYWPAGTFNSQVLATLEGDLWNPAIEKRWIEAHAQMFGFTITGNRNARPMNDKVMDNGYFPCLKNWAATEKTNAVPAQNAVCGLNPTP